MIGINKKIQEGSGKNTLMLMQSKSTNRTEVLLLVKPRKKNPSEMKK